MRQPRLLAISLSTSVLLGLSACGGGGSSDASAPATTNTTTFSGTAATGAAMSGAAISISCMKGTGSATTAANGSYSANLTDITLPCALKATSADGNTVLYSLTSPSVTASTNQTANITPLTQLLVAKLAGTDPASFFANLNTAASSVTAANVSSAQAAVLDILSNAGVNVSNVGDLLVGALVPATSSASGNAYDVALDALAAALVKSGTSLKELATAVASSDATPASIATQLAPAASTCAGLKSGQYHALDKSLPTITEAAQLVTVDASKLTIALNSGTVALTDAGNCHFTSSVADFYFAKSGVGVAVPMDNKAPVVLVPAQKTAISEFAGTWNILWYGNNDVNSSTQGVGYALQTRNAGGAVTYGADCAALDACVPWIDGINDQDWTDGNGGSHHGRDTVIAGDASGTWWLDGYGTRLFPFKNGEGKLVVFVLGKNSDSNGLGAMAKQSATNLPTVNQVEKFWDFTVVGGVVNGTPADTTMTIQSVDTATNSFTRKRSSDGRVDGFTINKPRDGLRYRPAGSSVLNDGVTTVNYRAAIVLPLGIGISVSGAPDGRDSLSISVTHP